MSMRSCDDGRRTGLACDVEHVRSRVGVRGLASNGCWALTLPLSGLRVATTPPPPPALPRHTHTRTHTKPWCHDAMACTGGICSCSLYDRCGVDAVSVEGKMYSRTPHDLQRERAHQILSIFHLGDATQLLSMHTTLTSGGGLPSTQILITNRQASRRYTPGLLVPT